MGQRLHNHIYRLRMEDDGHGEARDIEFNADEPYAALGLAQQTCGSRAVMLFEDGLKLADLKYNQGFWEIGQSNAAAAPATKLFRRSLHPRE